VQACDSTEEERREQESVGDNAYVRLDTQQKSKLYNMIETALIYVGSPRHVHVILMMTSTGAEVIQVVKQAVLNHLGWAGKDRNMVTITSLKSAT